MRKTNQWKSIFCIEGFWDSDLRVGATVKPALQLLSKLLPIKFIHNRCATVCELTFLLKKWAQKKYAAYPILYLSFHGGEGYIYLEDNRVPIDEISSVLEGKCANMIIVFGSCKTLNIGKKEIEAFLHKTGALAVCGYMAEIDWVKSTAHELLILEALQDHEYSFRGIHAIERRLKNVCDRFPELEFVMVKSTKKKEK